jgi:hypothetical protein
MQLGRGFKGAEAVSCSTEFGSGDEEYALPWNKLNYDTSLGGTKFERVFCIGNFQRVASKMRNPARRKIDSKIGLALLRTQASHGRSPPEC